ncbi:MAG: transposase [Desulfomonilaceae bacterium]
MSRPLRIEYPEAWYHVMNRGRRREAIFPDREDYLRFLDLLRQASVMWTVRIAGFCLMPNHYHLLVQTPRSNLSRFMRHVDGVYTQRFNRAHNSDGSLFRGRYKAILVEADTYLLSLLKYIHRNPLRAGIVSRLDRYAWSSHKGYLSSSSWWSWLYTEFAHSMLREEKSGQSAAYRDFMGGPESEELVDLFSQMKLPSILGSDAFINWVKAKFRNLSDHKEIPDRRLLAPGLEIIKSAVCASYSIDRDKLMSSNRGATNEPRNVAIYLARRLSGETLATIGKAFEISNYSSVSSVVCRMNNAIREDASLRKRVERIERKLQMIDLAPPARRRRQSRFRK